MVHIKGSIDTFTDNNPFVQFEIWFREHSSTGTEIPNSVSLGTASADGRVSLRTVLLKEYNDSGFIFYTNYNSKKSLQMLSNHYASLLFYWYESGRQVRIEGITEKISEKESEMYFKTRPRESKLSAWASEQSSVIPHRKYLEDRYLFYKQKFLNKPVEKPSYWGGFRLIPDWIEFWQDGENRLHDRITYTKIKNAWVIERLAP